MASHILEPGGNDRSAARPTPRNAGFKPRAKQETPYGTTWIEVALAGSLALTTGMRRHKIEQAKRALARGWRPDDRTLVVCRDDGQPIKPGSVTKEFTRTLARLGFSPLRFHDLPHTHTSQLLLANIHPKMVSERLGHASVSITLDTYSHVAPALHEAFADDIEALYMGQERTQAERT